MRILLTADLHYSLPQFDWVASVADAYDLVVLAGDHADISSPVDHRAQQAAIRASVRDIAARAPLAICSGNHDLDGRNDADEKAATWITPMRRDGLLVDGDTTRIGEVTVTVLAWWDGPVARERLATQLAEARPAAGPWLWVHHAPPEGPLSWTGRRHYGDPVIAEWVREHQPTGVLTGHIHQAPFTDDGSFIDHIGDTWLLNAGQQPGPVPAHVNIDLDAGTATWVSHAGVEEQPLP